MKNLIISLKMFLAVVLLLPTLSMAEDPTPDEYKNFDAAIYARAYEVAKMADLEWLEQEFAIMQRDLKISFNGNKSLWLQTMKRARRSNRSPHGETQL